jgi:hypothetical protein
VLASEAAPFADRDIAAAQVSALEVADRLYSLDQEKGRAALIACINDQRKFVDMQREYDTYVEQHSDRLPKKRATWLSKRKSATSSQDTLLIEKIVLAEPAIFLGTNTAVLSAFEPGKVSHYLKATDFGFRIGSPHADQTLGIELISDQLILRRNLARILAQIEFQSSFFDIYWLFIKADEEHIEWFSAIMTEVRLSRVGLLHLAGDEWHVIWAPDRNPPNPDRRNLLKSKQDV